MKKLELANLEKVQGGSCGTSIASFYVANTGFIAAGVMLAPGGILLLGFAGVALAAYNMTEACAD